MDCLTNICIQGYFDDDDDDDDDDDEMYLSKRCQMYVIQAAIKSLRITNFCLPL